MEAAAPSHPIFDGSVFARAGYRPRRASLVDLDPELFSGIGQLELLRIREIGAHVAELPAGRWEPRASTPEAGLGLLVLDGLLVRTIKLGNEIATELVGPGDLIRPWEATYDGAAIIPCPVEWVVLQHTRLAILGHQLASVAAECPGLLAALLDRTARRTRSQGILAGIAHLKRVDLRVLMLLWHVAERWGRVTADGVLVPVRLTHQRIAFLVGAQRPSVTAALSRMGARGSVLRAPERGFLLTEDSREELEQLCGGGERAVAPPA